MRFRLSEVGNRVLDTLYIGGGTPSQLSTEMLCLLFEMVISLFTFADGAEVTLEANPDDVDEAWLSALRHTPVNRISMGVQTFDDTLLRFLHRRHTGRQALKVIDRCREAGYENLSIDLIYGLPGQDMSMWCEDLAQVALLNVPHLSAYALQYEPGTVLHRMREKGLLEEVDEEVSLKMYQKLCRCASNMGMEHYEISNFALPGKRSQHNSSYWSQEPYWGFGPGAHSYDGNNFRRWNHATLRAYVEAQEDVPHGCEQLTEQEHYDELVMTRLRTSDGLPLTLLSADDRAYCLRMATPHLKSGKMRLENAVLYLDESGIFVSDDIMSDLMR